MFPVPGWLVLGVLLAAAGQPDVDQQALARQLLSEDREARDRAFAAAAGIDPPAAGPELRAALIALLEKQNAVEDEARRRGVALAELESPEFVAAVHHSVARLKDSQAIPAMARALGSFTVVRTLTAFRELAAPAVLEVVTSPASHYTAVNDGLRVLRWMVETQDERPLSPAIVVQIRRAAELRLSGDQYFTVLWSAIDLAAVLPDDGLRQIIRALSVDTTEVAARGVLDPELIRRTQRRAANRLAGVPALPRPQP